MGRLGRIRICGKSLGWLGTFGGAALMSGSRSEEHTSELQSQSNLVCRLLLEKKNRHDVHALALDQVDAGVEGGGLARAGGPRDEEDALVVFEQGLDRLDLVRVEPERIQRLDL